MMWRSEMRRTDSICQYKPERPEQRKWPLTEYTRGLTTCMRRSVSLMFLQETVVTDRRIEGLTERRGAESVPRAVASVTPVNSPLQQPRSLPLAVLIRSELI